MVDGLSEHLKLPLLKSHGPTPSRIFEEIESVLPRIDVRVEFRTPVTVRDAAL